MSRLFTLLLFIYLFKQSATAQVLNRTCSELQLKAQSLFKNQDEQGPKLLPSLNSPSRAVILLAHGLNNKPSIMSPLGEILNQAHYDVVRVSLKGHQGPIENMKKVQVSDWQNEGYLQYCQAKLLSEQKKIPLYLVAFSLGGLVYEELLNELNTVQFSKAVLFAPAITTRPFVRLIKFLSLIKSPETIISSWAPKNYRAQSGSSLGAYQALFELEDRLEKSNWEKSNFPTLVFIDPQDEVVFAEKLQKNIKRFGLNYWKIQELSTKDSQLKPRYHHLIIDQDSLGEKKWQEVTKELLSFLEKN